MKNRYVLVADVFLVALSAFAAFTARFDFAFFEHRPEFPPYLAAALVIKPPILLAFGLYRRHWQYTTIADIAVILGAAATSSMVMALFVIVGIGRWFDEFSRVVVVNDLIITVLTTAGLRVLIRAVHESSNRRALAHGIVNRRVLIVGAGAAGTMVAREMARNPQLGMHPVGFVDDDPNKLSKQLGGLRVIGDTQRLTEIVASYRVDEVVIAMPTAPGATLRQVVNLCREAGVKSQVMPGVFELLTGKVGVNRLRNVDISDLLRRSPANTGNTANELVRGRVVLVTGGGGSIGSELVRQIANASPKCIALLGHGENSIFETDAMLRADFPHLTVHPVIADIRDRDRMGHVFDRIKPQVVFHAAAHKHVPLMEENPEEAVSNNIIGTRIVVEQAIRTAVDRLVLISTDKAVSPTSVMGASKRIAELIVRQAALRTGRAFVSVRFGNVLGSRGSVVNTFKKQIERGGPVTVTHPQMTRFFMTVPEAVHLVLQASGLGKGGELFVLDMGEPVRIVDLAEDLIKLSGLTTEDVAIVFSGVRPGEKMHEALYEEGLRAERTRHPEVLEVIGAGETDTGELDAAIDALEVAARQGDRPVMVSLLERLVPGFVRASTAPN
jgi:FlaA1/EpsC-like NDP-sugar epimerase